MARKRPPGSRGSRTWTPSVGDYTQVLVEQNPWHRDGEVPGGLWLRRSNGGSRRCSPGSLQATDPRPLSARPGSAPCSGRPPVSTRRCAVCSVRASGRRTFWWLRLDHPLLLQFDLGALLSVVRDRDADPGEPAFVFLDELTYARDWDLWLKTFHDERWPIRPRRLVQRDRRPGRSPAGERRRDAGRSSTWRHTCSARFLDLLGRDVPLRVEATLAETLAAALDERPDLTRLAPLRTAFSWSRAGSRSS